MNRTTALTVAGAALVAGVIIGGASISRAQVVTDNEGVTTTTVPAGAPAKATTATPTQTG